MVEAPRHDGFRVPAPAEFEIRDLYGWSATLIDLGLRGPRGRSRRSVLPSGPGPGAARSISRTVSELFEAIVSRSDSREHLAAIRNLNDRLASLRLAEQRLFPDFDEEVDALREALGDEDSGPLRKHLKAYHRRRQRHAAELLMILRR